jgi:hypothetical protein
MPTGYSFIFHIMTLYTGLNLQEGNCIFKK